MSIHVVFETSSFGFVSLRF